MAVAHDASSESHTGTTASQDEASFSWTHTPVGTPSGVFVLVTTDDNVADVSSVDYGALALDDSVLTDAFAVISTGETMRTDVWFTGASVPTGAQTVQVNRTNNSKVMYAVAVTVTAVGDTQILSASVVKIQSISTASEQSVDPGGIGSDSVRYAGGITARNTPDFAGTNSTRLQFINLSLESMVLASETTAGQGSRLVGFTDAVANETCYVHWAVSEFGPTIGHYAYPMRML